jgi:hypothetical protein
MFLENQYSQKHGKLDVPVIHTVFSFSTEAFKAQFEPSMVTKRRARLTSVFLQPPGHGKGLDEKFLLKRRFDLALIDAPPAIYGLHMGAPSLRL